MSRLEGEGVKTELSSEVWGLRSLWSKNRESEGVLEDKGTVESKRVEGGFQGCGWGGPGWW